MDRLQQKCLVASAGTHALLLVLLVFGSGFFASRKKPFDSLPAIKVVPSRLVDDLLAGGGGNPKLPITEDRQKGQTLTPPPPAPPPAQPQPPSQRVEPPPAPAPAPKPAPKKVEPPKLELKPASRQGPLTTTKPPKDTKTPEVPPDNPLGLKPATRSATDKAKAEAEARARAARDQAAADARLARAIGRATESLQVGFADGTKVEVGGPGGEAYANYAAFVRDLFDNAWVVTPDVAYEDAVTIVKVVVARSGAIISKTITTRSGNTPMDRSVQRALDKVTKLPPFPEGSKDSQRSFTIEFNLRAKRLTG